MADIIGAVDTYLRTQTTWIGTLTGGLHPYKNASTTITYPYCTLFTVSDPNDPESFDVSDSGQARIQFDVIGGTKAVKSILLALRTILHQFQGTMGTVSIVHCECVGMRDILLTNSMYQFQADFLIEYSH